MLKKDKTIRIKSPRLFQVVPGFSLLKPSLYDIIKESAVKDGFKVAYIKEKKPKEDKITKALKKGATKKISLAKQSFDMNKKVFKKYGHTLTEYIEQFLFSNLIFFIEKEYPQVMGTTWKKHIKTIKRSRLHKRISLFGIRRFLSKIIRIKLSTMNEFMKYDASHIKEHLEIDKIYNWYKTRDAVRERKETELNKVYDALRIIESKRCPPFVKVRLKEMYSNSSKIYLSFYHWFFMNHIKITEDVVNDLEKQKWFKNVRGKMTKHFKQLRKIEAYNEKEDTLMMHRMITYRGILWS